MWAIYSSTLGMLKVNLLFDFWVDGSWKIWQKIGSCLLLQLVTERSLAQKENFETIIIPDWAPAESSLQFPWTWFHGAGTAHQTNQSKANKTGLRESGGVHVMRTRRLCHGLMVSPSLCGVGRCPHICWGPACAHPSSPKYPPFVAAICVSQFYDIAKVAMIHKKI